MSKQSNSPSSSTVSTGSSSHVRGCAQGRIGRLSRRTPPNASRRTSGGEGNFTCKTCQRKFVSKNAMYGHQNVHRSKPPDWVRDHLLLGGPRQSRPTITPLPPSPPPPSATPRGKEVLFTPYVVAAASGPPLVIGGSRTPTEAVSGADQPMVPIRVTHVVPVPVPMSMVVNGTSHGIMIGRQYGSQGSNPPQNLLRSEARGHASEGEESGNWGPFGNGGQEQEEVDLELRLGWK